MLREEAYKRARDFMQQPIHTTWQKISLIQFYGQSAASPNKKAKVADCRPCHVKLQCLRYSVHVDWPFASFNLKGNLQPVKISF